MSRVAVKTAQASYPSQGNRELPIVLDFTSVGTIIDNLFAEMSQSQIESIQSVYIDNSQNAASMTLQFLGTQQIINVQPYMQGIFPVIAAQGRLDYVAITTPGIKIPIIFSNTAKPLHTWGPTPGVNIVPPLTNLVVELAAAAAGDNMLIAGVANQTIKVYRGILSFQNASNVKFWSDISANNHPLTGTFYMFAGGGITMQPSGIPWFTGRVGDGLNLNSSAAVNIGGELSYVQS